MTVIVANPKTAGVARWIFLALWGHKANAGKAAATKYVTKVFDRVYVMPRDAREASDVFYTQKQGDALLTYENEAIFTNLVVSPTAPLPYICPPNNVRVRQIFKKLPWVNLVAMKTKQLYIKLYADCMPRGSDR